MTTVAERVGEDVAARLAAVVAEPGPSLLTIPNVELVAVGEWDAVTGPVTFTESQLRAAVAALDDPAVKAPRLRIGHTPENIPLVESAGGFEEQPAFGRFVNLRLADNGTKIVADMAGVPAWLAEILPSAYPSRSVEAYFDVHTAAGRKHDMVISSVALLGVSMPAVETLEDLRLKFGAETPPGVELVASTRVTASRGDQMADRVSASVTYTDVRRSFYEDFATDESGRYWWWICDFIMEPQTAIADDDEGGLWSVPYSIKGDAISWGEPVEVRVQYVEKDSGKVAAARAKGVAYATAADSRPQSRVRAANQPEGGTAVGTISTALLERLGLPEDATEEQALAKLDEINAESTDDDDTGNGDGDGDDTGAGDETDTPATQPEAVAAKKGQTVDGDALKQLQEDARLGREAREQQIQAEREQIVDERIKNGFITSGSRAAHLAELAKGGDIEKTHRAYLASLTQALVPVAERGVASVDDHKSIHTQVEAGLAAAGVGPRKEN